MTRTAIYDTTDGDAFVGGFESGRMPATPETTNLHPATKMSGRPGSLNVERLLIAVPHAMREAYAGCEWALEAGVQGEVARGRFSEGANPQTMKAMKMALAKVAGTVESPGDFTFGLTHDYVFTEWPVKASLRSGHNFAVRIHGEHKAVRVVLDGVLEFEEQRPDPVPAEPREASVPRKTEPPPSKPPRRRG